MAQPVLKGASCLLAHTPGLVRHGSKPSRELPHHSEPLPADYLSAIVWEYELKDGIEAQDYLDLIQTVSQADGAHNRVFQTIDQMPARTAADYENILARIAGLPRYVDQVIALLDEQLDAGLARPEVVVDLMLDQLASQRARPAFESVGVW